MAAKKTCTSNSCKEPTLPEPLNLDRYGPLVGGADLERLLGYRSSGAFRQAIHRGQLPIKVFALPQRRGKFAFTADLAQWLLQIRTSVQREQA